MRNKGGDMHSWAWFYVQNLCRAFRLLSPDPTRLCPWRLDPAGRLSSPTPQLCPNLCRLATALLRSTNAQLRLESNGNTERLAYGSVRHRLLLNTHKPTAQYP